jgi:tRNAThr (cytosine32-N3)-methyltransferase
LLDFTGSALLLDETRQDKLGGQPDGLRMKSPDRHFQAPGKNNQMSAPPALPAVDTEKHPNVSLFDITDEFIADASKVISESDNVVPDFWVAKYEAENSRNWEKFYKHNQSNFFKDRHYIPEEFALNELASDSSRAFHVVDMGCGVGNALLPMLEHFPNMTARGFDCSSTAVRLLNERLAEEGLSARCSADVGDLMVHDFSAYEAYYNTADFILLLFVQSAISPQHYEYMQELASRILKPGGVLLFRDYGKYDMAQLRFEKAGSKRQGNKLGEDFYVRGDGTRAKFFTESELRDIWERDNKFAAGQIVTHSKLFVNRKTGVEMRRLWIQGKWTRM